MEKKEHIGTLTIEGRKYHTTLTDKFVNRKKWEKPDIRKVNAAIPGTILEIFVKKGDKINKGDQLLLLEAMKMKNIITAPINGKIRKVYVKVGDTLPKNGLMIEFD